MLQDRLLKAMQLDEIHHSDRQWVPDPKQYAFCSSLQSVRGSISDDGAALRYFEVGSIVGIMEGWAISESVLIQRQTAAP
jgi:hypothetical protein